MNCQKRGAMSSRFLISINFFAEEMLFFYSFGICLRKKPQYNDNSIAVKRHLSGLILSDWSQNPYFVSK